MKKVFSIAIDGPSGSGKSTIADLVAKKLGVLHLNSGSLYRAYALACYEQGIGANEKQKVINYAKSRNLRVDFVDGKQQTILDGKIVDGQLRQEQIGMMASTISSYPEIRELVNMVIRSAAQKVGLVTEGRDIGSVVIPDADFKFYLDAKPEVRAKRRFDELKGEIPFEQILKDVVARDKQDMGRKVAPLKRCEDAIYIDSSRLDIDEVCDIILKEVEKKQ